MRLRWITILILLFLLEGCSKSKKTIDVLCYTSIPLEIMTEIKKDFENRYPTITLNVNKDLIELKEPEYINLRVFREGSGHVIARISAEQTTGQGIKADLLWIAEPSYYYQLKDQGYLDTYKSIWDKDIPAMFRDKDYCFWGARIICMVIAYNTENVKEPPQNWIDLIDPKWKGQIVIANPDYSGASLITIGALAQKFGWEYFEQLRANNVAVVKGNNVVGAKLATGEFNIGISIHNIIFDMKNTGSNLDYLYPKDGSIMITSPIAIFKDTQKKELSELFLNYILSPEGQKILVDKGNFIPVRKDVPFPPNTPTWDELMETAIDLEWIKDTAYVDEVKNKFEKIVLK